jgi:hypothetical protein
VLKTQGKDFDKKSIKRNIQRKRKYTLHVVNKFMIPCWNIIINRRGQFPLSSSFIKQQQKSVKEKRKERRTMRDVM